MREMKDSGYDWLGMVPKNWSLKRGRFLFSQRNEKGNSVNLELLSPSQKFGVIPQRLLEEWTTHKAVKLKENTDLSELKTVHKGDFCISLRSFQGGFEYSEYEGVVSPAYQIFHKNIDLAEGYYRYLFKDSSFIDKMNSYTMSLRDGKNISFFDFGNTYLPVPHISEQQCIASYLDSKCSKIDDIIEKQQSVIEKLKAYKASIITEAVTKGLNSDVSMKDSGVEWIGAVPEHWNVKKLKYILDSSLQYGANETGVEFESSLPRYIRITDILPNNTLKEDGKLSLPEDSAKEFILKNGDLLFARSGATVGKTFLYQEKVGRCAFAGYLIKASINKKANNPKFLYYYTLSNCYEMWKNYIFIQSTIQNIGADKYSNLLISIPPIDEQKQIADYLDQKCSAIDSTIANKQALIEKLTAYKKSLIYEVVTGKKEV